jgi:acyl carrier protein
MTEFLEKLAECIDCASIDEMDVIVEFPEWDSLSVLSVIAMLDSNYGVNFVANDFRQIRTANDLWAAVQSRKS